MNLWVVGLWVIFFILAHLFVGTLLGLLYVFNDPVLELVCLLASDVLNVGTCMCVYEHCSTEGGIFTYQNIRKLIVPIQPHRSPTSFFSVREFKNKTSSEKRPHKQATTQRPTRPTNTTLTLTNSL